MTEVLTEIHLALQSEQELTIQQGLEKLRKWEGALDQAATDTLFPLCLELLAHQEAPVFSGALAVIARQLEHNNTHMGKHVKVLVKQLQNPALMNLSQGENTPECFIQWHKDLCEIICILQATHPKLLVPNFRHIVQYLIEALSCEDNDIATVACEYWAQLLIPPHKCMDIWLSTLHPHIGRLVPALISCLKYHDLHVTYLEENMNRHDDQPDDQMTQDVEQCATLRNSGAMAFECLCRYLPNEVLKFFKPLVDNWLTANSVNWLENEAVMLAISAFTQAVGTPKPMFPIYAKLIPRMLEYFVHPRPLLRSISCFVAQHFFQANLKDIKDVFPKVFKAIITMVNDDFGEVQEMALRCLTAILAFSDCDILPHTRKINDSLVRANPNFQNSSRYTYYECISHLVGRTGVGMVAKDAERVLEPILEDFQGLDWYNPKDSTEKDTIMICQPLCIISKFGRTVFTPYVDPTFTKIIHYLRGIINKPVAQKPDSHGDTGVKLVTSQVIACLDLLSAMFEGQGQAIEGLVSKYDLITCLMELLQNKDMKDSLYQSAIALLGNISKDAYSCIKPRLDEVLDILETMMQNRSNAIKNNALWTLSHLAINETTRNEHLLNLSHRLANIVLHNRGDQGVIIKAALALTNMGMNQPEEVLKFISKDDIFFSFCYLLQTPFPEDSEKVAIFKNLSIIAQTNVKRISRRGWSQFCIAAAALDGEDSKLVKMLIALLKDVRAMLGNTAWTKLTSAVGSEVSFILRNRYKLY